MEIFEGVFLGDKRVASDAYFLKKNDIYYILNCTDELQHFFEGKKMVEYKYRTWESPPPPSVPSNDSPTGSSQKSSQSNSAEDAEVMTPIVEESDISSQSGYCCDIPSPTKLEFDEEDDNQDCLSNRQNISECTHKDNNKLEDTKGLLANKGIIITNDEVKNQNSEGTLDHTVDSTPVLKCKSEETSKVLPQMDKNEHISPEKETETDCLGKEDIPSTVGEIIETISNEADDFIFKDEILDSHFPDNGLSPPEDIKVEQQAQTNTTSPKNANSNNSCINAIKPESGRMQTPQHQQKSSSMQDRGNVTPSQMQLPSPPQFFNTPPSFTLKNKIQPSPEQMKTFQEKQKFFNSSSVPLQYATQISPPISNSLLSYDTPFQTALFGNYKSNTSPSGLPGFTPNISPPALYYPTHSIGDITFESNRISPQQQQQQQTTLSHHQLYQQQGTNTSMNLYFHHHQQQERFYQQQQQQFKSQSISLMSQTNATGMALTNGASLRISKSSKQSSPQNATDVSPNHPNYFRTPLDSLSYLFNVNGQYIRNLFDHTPSPPSYKNECLVTTSTSPSSAAKNNQNDNPLLQKENRNPLLHLSKLIVPKQENDCTNQASKNDEKMINNDKDMEKPKKKVRKGRKKKQIVKVHTMNVDFGIELKYMRIQVSDSMEHNIKQYFDDAITFVEKARSSEITVPVLVEDTMEQEEGSMQEKREKHKTIRSACLIHCREGKSRSVSVIIAYGMKKMGMTLKEAYEHVSKKTRENIRINDGFKRQLMDYELELFSDLEKNSLNFFASRQRKTRNYCEFSSMDDDLFDEESYIEMPQAKKQKRNTNNKKKKNPTISSKKREVTSATSTSITSTSNTTFKDTDSTFEKMGVPDVAKKPKKQITLVELFARKQKKEVSKPAPLKQTAITSFFKIVPKQQA